MAIFNTQSTKITTGCASDVSRISISDEDVLEIEVCVRRPMGTETQASGRAAVVDWDDEDYDSGFPPGGARERLCDLLRELEKV